MVNSSDKQEVSVEDAAENLLNYSIEFNDIEYVLNRLPNKETISKVNIEYELRLLKILSVGWAISFYMNDGPEKLRLSEMFWNKVKEFSSRISKITSNSIYKNFNYFETLKKRLDTYLKSLNDNAKDVTDPVAIIGPEFALVCGVKDDIHIIMAGSRIFNIALGAVRDYLASIKIL